jgi:hypothetical protein
MIIGRPVKKLSVFYEDRINIVVTRILHFLQIAERPEGTCKISVRLIGLQAEIYI